MKTLKRNERATIPEALVYGTVPAYGELAAMGAFIFASMFAVMGFINSEKLGVMGIVSLPVAALLGFVWVRLTSKRVRSAK